MAETVSRIPIDIMIEGLGKAEGELIRHLAPRTVDAILRAMPLEGRAAVWGREIYFQIPVKSGEEKAKSIAEKGLIAYWPMGNAFCIFYDKMRPYSPVNPIGKVTKNIEIFQRVRVGMIIRVQRM